MKNAFVQLKLAAGPPKAKLAGALDTRKEYRQGSDLSFYDSWQESTGKVRIRGRTLYQEIDRLVRSAAWQRLPKDVTDGVQSPARSLLMSIVYKYRKVALDKTRKLYRQTDLKNRNLLRTKQLLRGLLNR